MMRRRETAATIGTDTMGDRTEDVLARPPRATDIRAEGRARDG
jgi:hypothetical protein